MLARPATADIVYVLNSGDSSISILDVATRTELRRIPALREVHHLVLAPGGRDLLIADSGGNEMLFVDPTTGDVRRRERISNPYHLDFSPDGKHLVIASLRRNQVDIYDAENLTLLTRLRTPDKPSHMAFRPDGKVVYVTLQGSGTVIAISLETREVLWEAPVGREPAGIIWHRGRLIVGVMGADYFAVMNPETREVERQIPIGRGAHTIFASPDGKALWATSRVESRLAEIDPSTLEVRRVIDIRGGPDCVTFDPEGNLWVTLRWVGRIARVDARTGEYETIRVGRSPHGIFFQPRRAESVGN
ncbi:beta-propeller fold lactonase family protein [Roseomonas soli]|uniref:Beta-propeller fold lactonase family protein n=2 Tax=Neoroseomonas soli TaxID=1081025 RepID=A0A9X9WTX3_9PROT|nr:beta-propeller fold lactonase family protein [Neoroseomonas soli]